MAKRYKGKHSQNTNITAKNRSGGTKRARNRRYALLYWAAFPLFIGAILELRAGDVASMAIELAAYGILVLAAWLLEQGLIAEAAYNDRKVARPPAFPRKLFASALTGVGVGIATYFGWGQPLVSSVLLAIIAAATHSFAFGIDPLRKKGMEGMDAFETERVAKAIDHAEGLLSETLTSAKQIGDRSLEQRVEKLAASAREMFRAVEEDPKDLTSARKFLSIYLKGARDATVKFVDFWTKTKDDAARTEYINLLDDLENSFEQQRETMLLENRTDLDVEIEVLRDRLKQEGLRVK